MIPKIGQSTRVTCRCPNDCPLWGGRRRRNARRCSSHLCLSSRARRTLALSSTWIWSEVISISTTMLAIPGMVFCSRSRRMTPREQDQWKNTFQHTKDTHGIYWCLFGISPLPCVMVRRSSNKLRKESEATWGLPQRSVSSSTSSSNLIQRARSFHRISSSLSVMSSFSSTNNWKNGIDSNV